MLRRKRTGFVCFGKFEFVRDLLGLDVLRTILPASRMDRYRRYDKRFDKRQMTHCAMRIINTRSTSAIDATTQQLRSVRKRKQREHPRTVVCAARFVKSHCRCKRIIRRFDECRPRKRTCLRSALASNSTVAIEIMRSSARGERSIFGADILHVVCIIHSAALESKRECGEFTHIATLCPRSGC